MINGDETMYDLVIENGFVIDPYEKIEEKKTIAIKDGYIVPYKVNIDAIYKIDASGKYVFPGFIDFHTHVYQASTLAVNPDLLFPYGVTTVVDQGTAGYINFEDFYCNEIVSKTMRIKSFVNIYPIGQPGGNIEECLDPNIFNENQLANIIYKYKNNIIGIKIRFSKNTVGDFGIEPLQKTLNIAKKLKVPVCVHTTNPPIATEKLVSMLRKGDIYCHVFQGNGNTIINSNFVVKKEFWEAKKKGIIFDAANGRLNFSYDVAQSALAEKFFPDIISTDLTSVSFNTPGVSMVKNLPFVMSKYLSLGVPLNSVIQSVTEIPARLMGMENIIGTLKEGAQADVCICEIKSTLHSFADACGKEKKGNIYLSPEATILNGKILYLNENI